MAQVRGPQIRQVLTLELDADRPEQALTLGGFQRWMIGALCPMVGWLRMVKNRGLYVLIMVNNTGL